MLIVILKFGLLGFAVIDFKIVNAIYSSLIALDNNAQLLASQMCIYSHII